MAADALARLQRRLWTLISAPTGVADALPGLAAEDPEAAPLDRWVRGPDASFAAERLDVYANMYFYRLLETLGADYPKLKALIGEARFHNLVTDYLLAHPSENPSLRYAGAKMPGFVAAHALAREWPFVADLAALEWGRISIFDVEDFTPLSSDDLAAIAPDQWGEMVLTAGPALAILRTSAPVHRLWLALERHEEVPAISPEETAIAIWRNDLIVYHRPVSQHEAAALEALQQGAPFGEICGCFVEGDEEDISAAAGRAVNALGRWIEDKLLARVTLPSE